MARHEDDSHKFSRRIFLQGAGWAPMLFVPAPLHGLQPQFFLPERIGEPVHAFPFSDSRVTPHYPAKSPLEDVLRKVIPGSDEFVTEKYAFEIGVLLDEWSAALKVSPPALSVLAKFLDASLEASSLAPSQETAIRKSPGLEVVRRQFARNVVPGRERFLTEFKEYFAKFSALETAELQIVGIDQMASSPLRVRADIRYDLVGVRHDGAHQELIGQWPTQWVHRDLDGWRVFKWEATEETASRAPVPIFIDVTRQALGETAFAAEFQNGRRLRPEQALSLLQQGHRHHRADDHGATGEVGGPDQRPSR